MKFFQKKSEFYYPIKIIIQIKQLFKELVYNCVDNDLIKIQSAFYFYSIFNFNKNLI